LNQNHITIKTNPKRHANFYFSILPSNLRKLINFKEMKNIRHILLFPTTIKKN